jgi:hypothetical protein
MPAVILRHVTSAKIGQNAFPQAGGQVPMTYAYATLPQLGPGIFLSDSGIETSLILDEGRHLPAFASFPSIDEQEGCEWFENYYGRHLRLAAERGFGFILDPPTWRASKDRGRDLCQNGADLRRANMAAIAFCRKVREDWIGRVDHIVVSGVLLRGPQKPGVLQVRFPSHLKRTAACPQELALAMRSRRSTSKPGMHRRTS